MSRIPPTTQKPRPKDRQTASFRRGWIFAVDAALRAWRIKHPEDTVSEILEAISEQTDEVMKEARNASEILQANP